MNLYNEHPIRRWPIRYGPPQCNKCGVYGYSHKCPFEASYGESPYEAYWRKLVNTFYKRDNDE